MSKIEEFFDEFKNDIGLDAGAQEKFLETSFFERYTDMICQGSNGCS